VESYFEGSKLYGFAHFTHSGCGQVEEQIERPLLTQEQIRFGIERFRKLKIDDEEGKKRLIDNFINAIYLYDDKIMFTFNYKDGTKTVPLVECESSSVGSDTDCFGPPRRSTTLRQQFVIAN